MIKRYLSMLLLGIVTFSHGYLAHAGAIDEAVRRGVLKVGTNPAYVPFEMTDKKGRIVGFEIDLLREMSKALGVKLELVSVPYIALIPGLLASRFDLIGSGMTVTQERNLPLNFSASFIIVGQPVLLNPRLADKVQSIEDLNEAGYRIVAADGTTGEAAAKRFLGTARLRSFPTPEEGVRQVVEGKADAFIHDAPKPDRHYQAPEQCAVGAGATLHLRAPGVWLEKGRLRQPQLDQSFPQPGGPGRHLRSAA